MSIPIHDRPARRWASISGISSAVTAAVCKREAAKGADEGPFGLR
jgi:hypothetical protein